MPNLDLKTLKAMMDRLGIKTNELEASKVIIELADKSLIIDSPQVLQIEAQGVTSFQISGNITEVGKKAEINEEDVKFVMEQSGIKDPELARKALEEANGDIAEAIIRLRNKG
ncbi:MAG: nascent polypeptide-associated complex protein [Candidatus Micrarchaeia archaeon]